MEMDWDWAMHSMLKTIMVEVTIGFASFTYEGMMSLVSTKMKFWRHLKYACIHGGRKKNFKESGRTWLRHITYKIVHGLGRNITQEVCGCKLFWQKKKFLGCLKTTSCEGCNSFLKKYVKKSGSLLRFLYLIDNAEASMKRLKVEANLIQGKVSQ